MGTACDPVAEIWRKADAVCFDVDSTVIQEEGLDGLASHLGKGEEIRAITLQTMGGGLSFREALKRRLNLLKPTLSQVLNYRQERPSTLTAGIQDLVDKLHARGTAVYLVSGGFDILIHPVALQLSIPVDNCFCNKLEFNADGHYTGFDVSLLTSDSGGKGRVVQKLINTHNYENIVMIGDGATDAEASPPAHAFIGFGGNVKRSNVREKALWYVTEFGVLSDALEG